MSMKDHKSKHKTITHCACCKWMWAEKRREKKGSRRKSKQHLKVKLLKLSGYEYLIDETLENIDFRRHLYDFQIWFTG